MQKISREINNLARQIGRIVVIMELCGTHTEAVARHGIKKLLPENIKLLSGPGCPVCVTDQRDINAVIALAMEGVPIACYGDVLRVPGTLKTPNSERQTPNLKLKLKNNSAFKVQSYSSKLKIKEYRFPPILLDLIWNRLHIFPVEWLIGDVDLFISSDWTEPPTKRAKKATILYDLIVYKNPEETDSKIVKTQKRKLKWVKKESDVVFCISESTKKDAMEILNIKENRLRVIYPGI